MEPGVSETTDSGSTLIFQAVIANDVPVLCRTTNFINQLFMFFVQLTRGYWDVMI